MSALPTLEEEWGPLSGEEVGTAYVEALSASTRARHGRHYTPIELAAHLWTQARRALGFTSRDPRPLPGLVRDPACGAGSLLLPAMREHLAASSHVDARLVIARLPSLVEGIDNDPAAVWIANVVLAAEMLPLLAQIPERDRRRLPSLCRVGDGIAEQDQTARIVLMNPPYGRVRLGEKERERFAHVIYGHANLYGVFMAAAEQALDEDGILAALVPTSFLAGRYFAPLREHFSTAVRLAEVTFVEKRTGVFSSVLQETCLATFSRRKIRRTDVTSIRDDDVRSIARVPAPRGDQPWLLPRRSSLAAVAAAASQMPLTLAEAGWKVSTGPLVWNRRTDDLNPHDGTPVIWSADFDGGTLHTDARRSPMRFIRLHGDRDVKVMTLREPAILVQRTSAPEQSRRLTSTLLTQANLDDLGGTVVIENHVNVLRPTTETPALSMRLLARLLECSAVDNVARCISGSVSLSAFELGAIPLPNRETLASWEDMEGAELQAVVSDRYRRGASI